VESRVPEGKAPLRINMDETSLCLFQGGGKGNVITRKRRAPAAGGPAQKASRALRRTCLTHIAFVCDRPELQPLLPQVIIGNCKTFLLRDWPALLGASPGNVYLLRQKSAWNNRDTCCRVVRMLAEVLRPHLGQFQPVLTMDCCKVHLHRSIVMTCNAVGVWLVVVPAKLTWLLQPCDTHAFQPFKLALRASYQARRAGHAAGELGINEFLECVYEAIRTVLQGRRWGPAFDADGFGGRQAAVSTRVLRQMGLDHLPAVPSTEPSAGQIAACMPRRSRVPAASFLRPFAARRPVPLGRRLLPWPRAAAAAGGSSGGAVAVSGAFGDEGGAVALAGGRGPRTRAEHAAAARAAPPGLRMA